MYVDVEINDEQTVTLMVDTGATDISLKSRIATELGLSKGESQEATYNTANGPVQKFVTSLDSLRIGDIVHHNVQASFGEGLKDGFIDGLLGMSVLKYYTVDIDLTREELHLIPRQT
ncbi:MAG: retropepsin-like aspartic protease [Nitrospirota bacterium]|nr:retropepsin-like aspartic protease [Nitrospirota bacterium]